MPSRFVEAVDANALFGATDPDAVRQLLARATRALNDSGVGLGAELGALERLGNVTARASGALRAVRGPPALACALLATALLAVALRAVVCWTLARRYVRAYGHAGRVHAEPKPHEE